MPKFNAGRFMEANDLQLVGPGAAEGQVRVRDSGGVEKTLNIAKMLEAKGIKADEVIYNDPSAPLDTSPVDFTDRLKLSIGNAKGQVNYLKNKYQGAQLTEDGDMVVKDKGIWHRVDPKGMGDGQGWDLAAEFSEFTKDVADFGGDAVSTAGQLIGGALGAAGGTAVAPGAGTTAGAVVGSGIGAGIAKYATTALGRVVGTYDATPEEVVRDVTLDAVLSMGGEVVALGAKNMVVPAIKNGLKSISETAHPMVKNTVAKLLQSTAGSSEVGTFHMIDNAEHISNEVGKLVASSGKGATEDVLKSAARNKAIGAMAPILEDAAAVHSGVYRQNLGKVIRSVPEDAVIDTAAPIKAMIADLGELGVLKPVPMKGVEGGIKYVPVDEDMLIKRLGVDGSTALSITKRLGNLMNTSQSMLSRTRSENALMSEAGSRAISGKKAAMQSLDLVREFRDIGSQITGSNDKIAGRVNELTTSFSTLMRKQLPQEAQQLASSMDADYAKHLPFVRKAERAMASQKNGSGGIEAFLNEYKNGGSQTIANSLDVLSSRKDPTGGLKKSLLDSIATEDFIGITPKGGFNLSPTKAAAATGAFMLAGPAGAAGVLASGSPRAGLASVKTGVKMTGHLGKMLRTLSSASRKTLLADPKAFEALMGELARGMNPTGGQ